MEIRPQYEMKRTVLTINSGSSSLKSSLFAVEDKKCSKIHDLHLKGISSIRDALKTALPSLNEKGEGLSSLIGIGHRYVHGGSLYTKTTAVNATVIESLAKLSHLAPLHNDACLEGILACKEYFGDDIPQAVVFDTSFHSTLPPTASHYAIPRALEEKYGIRRFGFHGIAHAYLWETFTSHTGNKNGKIITLHLGNGCSATAIRDGKSVDTSMGLTPAEGLIMATRAGDIDAALVELFATKEKISASQAMHILNNASGLLGVSDLSPAMETLLDAYNSNERARLAVDMFCYRTLKYIGAYLAILQGADALLFSGGIGENSPTIRQKIVAGLEWLNIHLDEALNNKASKVASGTCHKISAENSATEVYVVGVDENAFIAAETLRITHR